MARSPISATRGPDAEATRPDAARARVAVLVVTPDGVLWTHLMLALPGLDAQQYDGVAELLAEWRASRPAVVIVDGRHDTDLAALVARLRAHGPALVPIAVVDEWTDLLAQRLERSREICGHLTVPIDAGSARALLGRAASEALRRLTPAAAPAGDGGAWRRHLGPRRLAAVAAAALVLAGAALLRVTPRAPPSVAPAAPLPVPSRAAATRVSAEEIETLLERARAAMRERRYLDPATDSALADFKTVLDLDPGNGEARQGLDRIAELLLGRAEAALARADYRSAAHALEAARGLAPDPARLAALDDQLAERVHDLALTQIQGALQANALARAGALIEQAERAGTVPAPALEQLRQEAARREGMARGADLARLAEVRIAQGRLLDPPTDSARYYLAQLQQRGDPALAAELSRLSDAFLRRATAEARAAVARSAWSDAQGWLAALQAAQLPASALGALQQEFDQARQQARQGELQRLAQLTRERTAAAQLTSPADDSALHYYRALAAADARHPALPALAEALVAALLEQARAAYASGEAGAPALLAAARELGAPASALAGVQATPAARQPPLAVAQPRPLRPLNPEYPATAEATGVEGWVEVGFEVSTQGVPANVHALDGQPKGVFEHAAVVAVRRARFEPGRAADGTPVASTARVRVRFTLQAGR